MVFPYNGIQLGNENEQITAMHNKMDKSHTQKGEESSTAMGELTDIVWAKEARLKGVCAA